MRIAILTNGSRGDVQPYVALGLGLQRAGYDVRVAAPAILKEFVEPYGLAFVPAGIDTNIMLRDDRLRELLTAAGKNPLFRIKHLKRLVEVAEAFAHRLVAEGYEACKTADAVLCAANHYYAGEAITEKLGNRLFYLNLVPVAPTRLHPNLAFPLLPKPFTALGEYGYNWFSHWLYFQIMWRLSRPMFNRVRRSVLDLPELPAWMPRNKFTVGGAGLYGYSAQILPRPSDWTDIHHVTGYWFLDPPTSWAPPTTLVAFLEAGPPPIYIGFGSMADENVEGLGEVILAALAQTGCLAKGWAGLSPSDLPTYIHLVDDVPHAWLFPRVAAAIHHGGAGTTGAAFRAGIPSIVIPFVVDQFFWGRRVYKLGVGPRAIPRKRLTTERLVAAIKVATTDQSTRSRAGELGERIQNDDGIRAAVNVIAQYGIVP